MGEKGIVLEDEPDLPLVRRHIGYVPLTEEDPAAVRSDEPGENPQKSCLARTGWTENEKELSFRYR